MSLKNAAEYLASKGRGPDTMLVHMAPSEVAGLQQLAMAAGGSLSLHPDTGLPEAGFLSSLLPTIIGVGMTAAGLGPLAAAAGGALAGAATNKQNPLMGAITGGMGGYGGAGLTQGLSNLGTQAAAQGAAQMGSTGTGLAASSAPGLGSQGLQATAAQTVAPEASKYALSQPAATPSYTLAQTAPQTMTAVPPSAPAPASWESVKAGAGRLTQPGGFGEFVGTAADKTKGIEATGMGGTGKTLSSAYMAAAPVIAAPPEAPKQEADEEAPGYSFDWNDIYREGGGFTRTYARGGETDDKPKMAGASAAAMDYLMGKTSVSPQTIEMQKRAAPPKSIGFAGGLFGPVPNGATSIFGNVAGRVQPGTDISFGTGVPTTGTPVEIDGVPQYTYNPTTQSFSPVIAAPKPTASKNISKIAQRSQELSVPIGLRGGGQGGGFAAGGGLESGGFVVPADVVSALGNGSSSAGLEVLAKRFGAKHIDGPGDGMSDSIQTTIEGRQRARVARDEAYIPPEKVQAMGGAKKLYAMMDRIRASAHGKTTQQRKVNPNKVVR